MILKKMLSYLTFKKQESSVNSPFLRYMHGINRISILMFLAGIVVLIYKWTR